MGVTHPAPRETPPSPSLQCMHKCAYNGAVSYEWDPAKARANLSKHGVDFADAATAFEDVVVYTWREESVRLISARFATAREKRQHQEGL